MAHKLAWWTAKNIKDSKWQRLWIKKFWWEKVKSWNIIVRQRWTKWHPWKWVWMWKDFTIFAIQDWVVEFTIKRKMKFNWRTYKNTVVNVVSEEVKKAPVKKTAAKKTEAK